MPAAIAIPLISAGISGGAAVAGAAMSSSANKNAANIQAQGAQNALDFTKGQKAKQEAADAPYVAMSQIAAPTIGAPPSPYSVAPGGSPQGQQTGYSTASMNAPRPAYGQNAPMSASMAPASSSAMVTLQAPDGSTRSVPSNVAQQYIARGAKQISA